MEELREVVIGVIGSRTQSFDFATLTSNIGNTLNNSQKGFTAARYTTYAPHLNQADIVRIREIVWDLIISRHLTIGNYYNDEWPHLSVTEKGKTLFSEDQPMRKINGT